jgi:YVTN family beta-propeller protein
MFRKRAAHGIIGALIFMGALASSQAETRIAVDTFPMSAAVTPDGKFMLVMNAGVNPPSISVIDLDANKELSRTPVPDAWQGLVMTKAGDKVYVGGGSRAAVYEFSFVNGVLKAGRTFPLIAEKDRTPQDFAGDVKLAPDGHLLYVANVFRDSVVVMNPQSGVILSRIRTGRRPYRILFHPSGKTMYVSSWADGTIGQYDVNSGERLANFRVAPHPTDMVWVDGGLPAGAADGAQPDIRARVFVPAANTNSLYVFGASETGDLTKLETMNLALTPQQPLGTTPSAAVLSSDKKMIYVACSDANDVAVIDITGDRNLIKGFLPAGGYPTAVVALPDGRIGVLNGHGNSVELIDAPDDAKLNGYTSEVMAKVPYHDEKLEDSAAPAGNPVRAGGPIKHVVYVVRDAGNGSPAPNAEKLAREFVSLPNFQTALNNPEGVNWATAAIAPDFTVRLAQNYAANRRRVYDFEGQDPANIPPAGYLWNAVSQVGLKLRNYGFQVHNLAKPNSDGEQIDRVYDPTLAGSTDMEYRGADAAYADTDRAKEFATEIGEYGTVGTMPDLLLVRIGNDDQALGMIAEAVSKSRFWGETAMFVVDAAKPAAGKPDAPPTPVALMVSPWANRGALDTSAYTQSSVLRTIEVILGLRPLTVFDAAAAPMFDAFAATPTRAAYTPAPH